MDQCDYISGCDLEFRSYNYEKKNENKKYGTILFLFLFLSFMIFMGYNIGIGNMINTAYSLLIETVFYIMAIAVMAGALSSLLSELGVISFVDKILSPLMFPIYFSDNPAILALAKDKSFRKYFKKYQLPSITNLGNCRTNCKPNK